MNIEISVSSDVKLHMFAIFFGAVGAVWIADSSVHNSRKSWQTRPQNEFEGTIFHGPSFEDTFLLAFLRNSTICTCLSCGLDSQNRGHYLQITAAEWFRSSCDKKQKPFLFYFYVCECLGQHLD